MGGYFSLKLTGKLGRDFSSSKLADRRNQKRDYHWDASAPSLVTSVVGVSLLQRGEVPAIRWVGSWPGPRALLCLEGRASVLHGERRQVLCGGPRVSVLLWLVLHQDRRGLLSRLWRHVYGNRTCHQRYILNVSFRQKKIKTFGFTWFILFLLILYVVQKAIK